MNNFQNQINQPNNPQGQPIGGSKPSGLFSLPPSVMNFVPWMPLMLEMMTGQKIPQMGGTMAEIQQGISQIQMTLGQIIQHQQSLEQRLTALETNATSQFTNLVQEVKGIKSVRLTHDRERKQIELHGNVSDFDKSRQYTQDQDKEY